MVDSDKSQLVMQLRERMVRIAPLEEEIDFFVREDTLLRFLKARAWNVDEAEKQLKDTVEWRRQMKPLSVDCKWCHERPGYHCVRQVGFDKEKRPVIYASFIQAAIATVEDTVVHMTHLVENAKRTMSGSVSNWVFIMDCTGMTLPACNPRLGYGVTNALGTYYPERLGLVVCINHNPVFQGVWNAFKVFLDPNTIAKMHLIRKRAKYQELFNRIFDEELSAWLIEEVKRNKQRPLPASQRQFWKEPEVAPTDTCGTLHDPRGCASYVRQYVDSYLTEVVKEKDGVTRIHQPHPNIIDTLRGSLQKVVARESVSSATNGDGDTAEDYNSDDETPVTSPIVMDELKEEYRLPKELLEKNKTASK